MAALGPISPITSCACQRTGRRQDVRGGNGQLGNAKRARPYTGWVARDRWPTAVGVCTHLVGSDGDVGAVEEGVALDEVVGGERVGGDGVAAGDGCVVRADVEAVAEAEEVVRRRHAPAGRGRRSEALPGDDRSRTARAGSDRGGSDLVKTRVRCYVTLLTVEKRG